MISMEKIKYLRCTADYIKYCTKLRINYSYFRIPTAGVELAGMLLTSRLAAIQNHSVDH